MAEWWINEKREREHACEKKATLLLLSVFIVLTFLCNFSVIYKIIFSVFWVIDYHVLSSFCINPCFLCHMPPHVVLFSFWYVADGSFCKILYPIHRFVCKLYFMPSLNIIIWHWTNQYGIIYSSFRKVNFFMVILPVCCLKCQVFCYLSTT